MKPKSMTLHAFNIYKDFSGKGRITKLVYMDLFFSDESENVSPHINSLLIALFTLEEIKIVVLL
jgi:hypothetical protein